MKTTMFATDMVDPVIGFDIPGKPRTTASTITSTMTPATSRMKEGMTGANAPQVLLEVESVIFYTWNDIGMRMGYCYVETLDRVVELHLDLVLNIMHRQYQYLNETRSMSLLVIGERQLQPRWPID